MIYAERIYNSKSGNGFRILVDRLWPRGLRKEDVKIDLWLKEIAPSKELRNWFGHDPERWPDFKVRFFLELEEKKDLVDQIIEKARTNDIVLLYSAKDENHNNAVALKEYIEKKTTHND